MRKIIPYFSYFLTLAMSLLPILIDAGGIILYEIAAPTVGLASAGWAARAEDPSTLFTNPAGMSRLNHRQIQLGVQPIYTHVDFDPDAETNVEGDSGHSNEWIPAGSFFYVHPVSEHLTVGIGSLGYFGSVIHFNDDWVGRYYVDKIVLEGFSLVPAAAVKICDQLSIGAGINVMYGIFKQRNAIRNALDFAKDGKLSLHDEVFGAGAIVGLLYEFSCDTRFGIQYLSQVHLPFKAKPKFRHIGPLLEKLLAATRLSHDSVDVTIRVPQSVMASLYHDINGRWAIMGNVGWQQWSKFEKVSIALTTTDARTLTFQPKYQDTWHVAIGAEYHCTPCWTFFSGIAYDSSAVKNSERSLDFPVGEQWRFGFGSDWNYSSTLTFNFSYTLAWTGNAPVNVNRGLLAGHVEGKFKNLYAQFFSLSVDWLF